MAYLLTAVGDATTPLDVWVFPFHLLIKAIRRNLAAANPLHPLHAAAAA